MGATASEPMTEARAVYWTRFPARAIAEADWSDPWAAHRSVMRLFPQTLPGPKAARRATAGILYRLDVVNSEPVVLVQSLVQPELLPTMAKTLEFDATTWQIPAGTQIVFRVAYNPLARQSIRGIDATRTRIAERPLNPNESRAWLQSKLSDALDEVIVLNARRRATPRKSPRDHDVTGAPKRMTMDVVDASATVKDAVAFADLRIHGVGRAKSYGCGLLTARAIG